MRQIINPGRAGKLFIFLITVLILFTSCRPAGFIFTEEGKVECGADGQPIILTNNATAADPTFDEMVAFIRADITDKRKYITEGINAFVCADFAEAVHNNAEAVGIRAGWVSLTFEGSKEGHALNAFETSDKGLVYIDCTNSGAPANGDKEAQTWDAIAYIEKGKKYGVLPVERVTAAQDYYYPLEYDFYLDCEKVWQEFKAKLAAYNSEVDRYNREISNRVLIYGSPEATRYSTWKEELVSKEKELNSLKKITGGHWLESEYSSYLVKSVNIHW